MYHIVTFNSCKMHYIVFAYFYFENVIQIRVIESYLVHAVYLILFISKDVVIRVKSCLSLILVSIIFSDDI